MSLEYKPSLGFVETAGLVIAIQVADAMAKAAEVEIIAAHKAVNCSTSDVRINFFKFFCHLFTRFYP